MNNPDFKSIFEKVATITELSEISKNIDGWLNDMEGVALYAVAKYGPEKGNVVEIGSFKGKSTVWIAKGLKSANREKVFAIDPHTGSVENKPGHRFSKNMPSSGSTKSLFLRNLKKYEIKDWVIPLTETSQKALEAWGGSPIRLLFIDGDHRYRFVEKDFLGWERFLVRGGIIAFHDYGVWPGPTEVVDRYLRRSSNYTPIGFIKSLALFIKNKK